MSETLTKRGLVESYEPFRVCCWCNKPIGPRAEFLMVARSKVATHVVEVFAHPSCAENNPYWPRPIPVSERLPEDHTQVLAHCDSGGADWWGICAIDADGKWREITWCSDGTIPIRNVTHWLPLPPKPE
jgi:hypothetical protein